MTEGTIAAIAGAIAVSAGNAGVTASTEDRLFVLFFPPAIALLFAAFCHVLVRRSAADVDRKIAAMRDQDR